MSAVKSDWHEVCGCHHCGYLNTYSHKLTPCAGCGGYGSTGSWDRFVVRNISYTLIHRIALFLARQPQPKNHIEWKDGKMPRFFSRRDNTKEGFIPKLPKDAT